MRSSGSKIPLYSLSKTIKPGDDFYKYVNQIWLQKAKIPPTRASFGVSEEIEKQIEDQTELLLKECVELSKLEKQSSSYLEQVQQMLGTLTTSVYSADETSENRKLFDSILSNIQGLNSKEEVGVVLGEFLRYKIRSVFTMYAQYENKNNTNYSYTIGTGGLGLDPSFYFKRSLHRATSFALYKRMIARLEKKLEIPALHCVVKLERILAGVLLNVGSDTIEHKRTGAELENEFQYIPFESIFSSLGLSHWKQRIFFVESLRWLHTLNKLFHHLGLDYWKLLLSYEFILYALPWLPPEFSDISFGFYRKHLRGQQKKIDRKDQAIYVIQQYATPFFSRLYVEKVVDKKVKPQVKEMIEMILERGKERIQSIEWLEPQTREKAKEKIEKMRFIVGYPDQFQNHSIPRLSKTNLLENLLILGEEQTKMEIEKLGQPISQQKEWDDAVFVVNAYYYTQANEMVIPAGILQYPFYDESCSDAWNLGALGCILCHELTHAFDKEGKEYDPQGYQKKWWSPSDNRNYNKQTKSLVELYSKQKLHGLPVSGKKTLSENIADIGGMGLALDALHSMLDSKALTGEEREKALQEFFVAYATSWRLKDNMKKRIQAVIMDKHAPPNLRVNLVVSQFEEWYTAFSIQEKDSLYIPPEKRIHIF
jgi:putative endopeptidase